MQTVQLLCWSGMTDSEHRTTSGSNEEKESKGDVLIFLTLKGKR